MTIRPTEPNDVVALQKIVDATNMFPSEMLPEMIAGYLSQEPDGSIWLTCTLEDQPIGFCYAVPEALAEGSWNMLAIAVDPIHQGGGHGAAIVRHLEQILAEQNQRILIADTSDTDAFAQTRAFYAKCGYAEEARIRDFWAPGEDKIVFWKRLN